MSSDSGIPQGTAVQFTPEFKRNLRQLAKKYRRIKSDLEELLTQLSSGETPGDLIKGVDLSIYKVRARNSDSKKGKSGGYRIIYQKKDDGSILLITIYSKAEQGDISANEIRDIILDENLEIQTWPTERTDSTSPPMQENDPEISQ